jgi:formylglycine-generating enzyme required for sulfatase activity
VINGGEASPASDQFALACVLVEMLAGASPFAAPTPIAVITKHTRDVDLPAVWAGDVPRGVTAVLRRALQPEPQERFARVNHFIGALTKSDGVEPINVEGKTPPLVKRDPQIGDEYQLALPGGVMMDFVYVPAGEFWMGAAEDDEDADDDERPQHKVYLDGYWMAKYPVTNAQYQAYVQHGSGEEPLDAVRFTDPQKHRHPVVEVSWYDAHKFCMWLSRVTGQTIALPTEAEWEKAARGTDGRKYPWGNQAPSIRSANFDEAIGDTTPVDQYPGGASPYGALDMAGNVWEWCADWFDGDYYKNSPPKNSQGPDSGDYRVQRGGSWDYPKSFLRLSPDCTGRRVPTDR